MHIFFYSNALLNIPNPSFRTLNEGNSKDVYSLFYSKALLKNEIYIWDFFFSILFCQIHKIDISSQFLVLRIIIFSMLRIIVIIIFFNYKIYNLDFNFLWLSYHYLLKFDKKKNDMVRILKMILQDIVRVPRFLKHMNSCLKHLNSLKKVTLHQKS